MSTNTRIIKIGNTHIGGGLPIAVQSMTNTDTKNIEETVAQISALQNAGCEIIRVAVYDMECAGILRTIKDLIDIPIVADIHFDYKLALAAIENGADKVRINPGNIGGKAEIRMVADAAKANHIPIRVGSNTGSLSKTVLREHGARSAAALFDSALQNIKMLEECGFDNIVVSIKSSSPAVCVDAARLMSKTVDYPLHLGVTEAGTYNTAIIKSSAAIGSLLLDGIGDTIRVSITGDPVTEVIVAIEILKCCGLRNEGVDIISCPTCARCSLDLKKIADSLSEYTKHIKTPITAAVMGCAVNGPGEAKDADIGVAGGNGYGLLFKAGKVFKKVPEEQILSHLMLMIEEICAQNNK